MRVAIPTSLPRDEIRRRIREKSGELAGIVPGGIATVETAWKDDDTMAMGVTASIGASALTFATAKFAYLKRPSAVRLPATPSASQRLRRTGSSLRPIAPPTRKLNATEPRTSAR